jgi:hypothetical protein
MILVHAVAAPAPKPTVPPHVRVFALHGYLVRMPHGNTLAIQLRNGRVLWVDASIALAREQTVPLYLRRSVLAQGFFDPRGIFHAISLSDTTDAAPNWPPDGPVR